MRWLGVSIEERAMRALVVVSGVIVLALLVTP